MIKLIIFLPATLAAGSEDSKLQIAAASNKERVASMMYRLNLGIERIVLTTRSPPSLEGQ